MMIMLSALCLAAAHADPEPASESGGEEEPKSRHAAHSPEWADHNGADPGIIKRDSKVPSGARVSPSQSKVLLMPSAVEHDAETCNGDDQARHTEPDSDGSASVTFGDGRRGRIPASSEGECESGDPDRPLIRGDLPNPDADPDQQ